MKRTIFTLTSIFFLLVSYAQKTEVQYLSGTGLGDEKIWKFYCTDGMNSKKWSKIKVPSQWELQGFGEYTYGRWYKAGLKNPSMEQGFYEYSFTIPSAWKDKSVSIIFEAVMTDTEVKINGQLAGEIHQGGFYQFSYDITDKLQFGRKNKLEVKVSKHSANNTVNNAERKADWWIFGGIYRPVYLEAKPKVHIERIAVNAKMNGELYADVFTRPLPQGYTLDATITPVKGEATFSTKTFQLNAGKPVQHISASWNNVENWTPETPHLYYLKLELRDASKALVHVHHERIGFRTVEFRRQDGVYVNDVKVVLKGINRHSFHPDGGRTTNKETSLMDVKLIKEMNMNAVRFHYPADKHFLEACDSLGLFVMDELAGWQNAYDTKTGEKLLTSLISRDVNHPSIIIWSNGNEGGWNTNLDAKFYELDPQKRHVVHPWADFDDLDTHHYPAYQTGVARFTNGYKVFLPTEFMHGMYDQGHGAGLEDFWNKYTAHPLFAGGFMWDFSDNAVKRVDKGGILDTEAFNGPDGILGPYREKEGSYYTVREIWSPVQLKNTMITPSFKGIFEVKNDYLYTSFANHKIKYKLVTISSPLNGASTTVVEEGYLSVPLIGPGESGKAVMKVSDKFFHADVLELEAFNADGVAVCNWSLPIKWAKKYADKELATVKNEGKAELVRNGNILTLKSNNVSVDFNLETAMIDGVKNGKSNISFNKGPVAVGMVMKLKDYKFRQEVDKSVLTFYYLGGVDSIRWEMSSSGMLSMSAVMLNRASGGGGFDDAFFDDNIYNLGFTFSYPEANAKGMKWYGRGPYRVWKNRIKGTNYGLWEKEYNNTVTGESFENLIYPEFKGYHANMYWATLQNKESDFSFYSESDGVYFRVFTPEEPKYRQDGINTMPDFPEGDLSFLYEIPAIRCFKPIPHHGPLSQPGSIRIKQGDEGIKMKLWFDFR